MKLKPYFDRLNSSQQYKDFIKENADAFLVAGFFIIDFEMGKNLHQIDFYIPSKKKIAAFTLDNKITLQLMDTPHAKVPEALDIKTKIDLESLPAIVEDEMKNRNITESIQKIIAIIQNIDGKKIWNLSCILSGMGLLRAHIEDETRSVLKMEKLSLMDFIKRAPLSSIQSQSPSIIGPGLQQEGEDREDAEKKLKQLERLEQEIEREKAELKKATEKKNQKENSKPVKKEAKKR